eukprot:10429518-Alexandrium_andersonii.AAC.1
MGSGLRLRTEVDALSFLQLPASASRASASPGQRPALNPLTPEFLHVVQPGRKRPPRSRFHPAVGGRDPEPIGNGSNADPLDGAGDDRLDSLDAPVEERG